MTLKHQKITNNLNLKTYVVSGQYHKIRATACKLVNLKLSFGKRNLMPHLVTNRKLFFNVVLLLVCLALSMILPAGASNEYDGTYDYSYTYSWAGSQSTMELGEVFIVQDGDISITGTSSFWGSVDSFGGVEFYGPSPMGGETATFTGVIDSDGVGSGSWRSPAGAHGSWYVTRVSGGAFSLGGTPTSWAIAAVVGVVVFSIIGYTYKQTHARSKGSGQQIVAKGKLKQPTRIPQSTPVNASYTPPAQPPTLQGPGITPNGDAIPAGQVNPESTSLPPFIGLDSGVAATGPGAQSVPPEIGGLPFLNAAWFTGGVDLTWGTPQFDPSKYQLVGYDVFQQMYGPNSTQAQSQFLQRVAPNAGNGIRITPLSQSYFWNTGGDIAGFRVDPVFSPVGQNSPLLHHGGLGVGFNQTVGSFGVGP